VALAPRQAGSARMAFASGRLQFANQRLATARTARATADHLQRVCGSIDCGTTCPKSGWFCVDGSCKGGRPARDSPATRQAANTVEPLATDAAEQSIAAGSAPMAQPAASGSLVCADHRPTFPPHRLPAPRCRRFLCLAGNRRRFPARHRRHRRSLGSTTGSGRACRILCFASTSIAPLPTTPAGAFHAARRKSRCINPAPRIATPVAPGTEPSSRASSSVSGMLSHFRRGEILGQVSRG